MKRLIEMYKIKRQNRHPSRQSGGNIKYRAATFKKFSALHVKWIVAIKIRNFKENIDIWDQAGEKLYEWLIDLALSFLQKSVSIL